MAVTSENDTQIVETENRDVVVSEVKESTVIESGGSTVTVESEKQTTIVTEEKETEVVLSECIVRVESGGSAGGGAAHLEVEFDFQDVSSPISLGYAPEDSRVQNTFLEILTPFDSGLQITIGTAAAVALLMRIDENTPSEPGHYKVNNNVKYDGRPELFLFFNTANPTTGTARATVYFN